MSRAPDETEVLHASCIAVHGHAALIIGPSGSGKSGLALQLIALGARLVSDDRTRVWRSAAGLMADVPPAIRGQIEARGLGILAAEPAGASVVQLVIDMAHAETERLPPLREVDILGFALPCIRKSDAAHFPAAILLYLQGGRLA